MSCKERDSGDTVDSMVSRSKPFTWLRRVGPTGAHRQQVRAALTAVGFQAQGQGWGQCGASISGKKKIFLKQLGWFLKTWKNHLGGEGRREISN